MKTYELAQLWSAPGWLCPAYVSVDDTGMITRVSADRPEQVHERVEGHVLPGVPNVHSHAFQRAMAGLTEHASGHEDSFWSWRELMYRAVERFDPESLEAVAAYAYAQMLEAGYTAVGEFHYLHHDPDGRPYADPTEMSRRILAAASRAGIGVTLLAVLYAHSGFGGQPTTPAQRRFASDVDFIVDLLQRLVADCGTDPQIALGVAPHSLRAASTEQIRQAVAELRGILPRAPVHIHVAEQLREVEECLAHTGRRPVEALLQSALVDDTWCLVHATHITPEEARAVASAGAVVGLCPTTEANLGDGVPPVAELVAHGVGFCIGSDSHVSLSVVEELRWLEYVQRLLQRRRNVLCTPAEPSVAANLLATVCVGGARALGRSIGRVAVGHRADFVVLESADPTRPVERVLDAWLFTTNTARVRDVMVGGKWVVRAGRHIADAELRSAYVAALRRLAL